MKSLARLTAYGVLTWLMPFLFAIPFYSKGGIPLINATLLKSITILFGSAVGAIFLILYFKAISKKFLREGIIIGFSWLAINWLMDIIFLLPMAKMPFPTYFVKIGILYFMIPMYSITIGFLLEHKKTS